MSDYEALLALDAELDRSRLRQEAKHEAFDALAEACQAFSYGGVAGNWLSGQRLPIAVAEEWDKLLAALDLVGEQS